MFLATGLVVRVEGESSEEEEIVILWKISTFAQHRLCQLSNDSLRRMSDNDMLFEE